MLIKNIWIKILILLERYIQHIESVKPYFTGTVSTHSEKYARGNHGLCCLSFCFLLRNHMNGLASNLSSNPWGCCICFRLYIKRVIAEESSATIVLFFVTINGFQHYMYSHSRSLYNITPYDLKPESYNF